MEEQAGNLAAAVAIFRLEQQAGRAAAMPVSARQARLPAPRKPAANASSMAKPAKAAGGDEWTEF
jgi:hypothetical protein